MDLDNVMVSIKYFHNYVISENYKSISKTFVNKYFVSTFEIDNSLCHKNKYSLKILPDHGYLVIV